MPYPDDATTNALEAVLRLHHPVRHEPYKLRLPGGPIGSPARFITVPHTTSCACCDAMLTDATEGDLTEAEWPCPTVEVMAKVLGVDPGELARWEQ